jgi:serine/threonine protein kinase/Tol biopolymer transport system component
VRQEVEALLAEDAGAEKFLERPALETAAKMFAEDLGESLIGRDLGCYQILSFLGKGGMGEVYRAQDTNLRREVALKVLPEAFAHDPERLARFRREAQLLASLNHNNIGAIYELEQSGNRDFLVLEMVPGETLRERIVVFGPLPVDEALGIAKQIAEALEAAHEKGIVHRDLKPANIKITPEGKVKVLDFGLAKAFAGSERASDPFESPVLTASTVEGTILGTAAYMSPEQACGKKVDKRSDIWAFGCVLYELLTGKQAFAGETVTETLAAVVKAEPDWTRLPRTTPASIRVLLRRCLQKDLRRRLRDATDARIEIEDALSAPAAADPRIPIILARPVWRRIIPWGAGLLAGALISGFAIWNFNPTPPKPIARTVIALPPDDRLVARPYPVLALSPDGAQLAYQASRGGNAQIYLRRIDSLEARPLSGTEDARSAFFSPDGQWLGFSDGRKLKRVSVSGGAPVAISDGIAASWGSNNMIVTVPATDPTNLLQVSAAGGTPQPLTHLEAGEMSHAWPEVLPGGKAVVFTVFTNANPDDAQIVVQSLKTGKRKVLVNGGSYTRYARSGHLVYIRRGTLLAVPFDLERLEITGPAVPVLEGVMESPRGAGYFSLANNGLLVYVPGGTEKAGESMMTLAWVDRSGVADPLKLAPRPYRLPRVSPDGQHLAVVIAEARTDIWMYSLMRDTLSRLTFDGGGAHLWTRDGKRLAFSRGCPVFWKPADGSGPEEELTTGNHLPGSFTLDGRSFLYTEGNPKTGLDIWMMPFDGSRKPRPFLRTPYNDGTPRLSPDDRYVAYASDESGRFEVYVQPFPGLGGKYQITSEGAREIVWAANGELFYRTADNKMMAVEIKTQPTLIVGKPHLLFAGNYEMNNQGNRLGANYDVTADGQRFIMLKSSAQQATGTQIIVVENWLEELRQRVPVH